MGQTPGVTPTPGVTHDDTTAIDVDDEPLGFGREHFAAQGWDPGKPAHN